MDNFVNKTVREHSLDTHRHQKAQVSNEINRAGFKPLQPMRLHWAALLWGPAPWCLGRWFIFCQMHLALENSVETPYEFHC